MMMLVLPAAINDQPISLAEHEYLVESSAGRIHRRFRWNDPLL